MLASPQQPDAGRLGSAGSHASGAGRPARRSKRPPPVIIDRVAPAGPSLPSPIDNPISRLTLAAGPLGGVSDQVAAAWDLCRRAYQNPLNASVIGAAPGVVPSLVALFDADDPSVREAACGALHNLCSQPDNVAVLARHGADSALSELLVSHVDDGEPLTERCLEDCVGLMHKMAHANPAGQNDRRCRRTLVEHGAVPVLLDLLRRSLWQEEPPSDSGGGAAKKKKKGKVAKAAAAATPPRRAANERVLEDLTGVLRNLTEEKFGREEFTQSDDGLELLVKLIQRETAMARSMRHQLSQHAGRHGFSGYTFERVERAAAGVLHNVLSNAVDENLVTGTLVYATAITTLAESLDLSGNQGVQEDAASVLHCLACSSANAALMVESNLVWPVVQLVMRMQREAATKLRLLDASISLVANIAYYATDDEMYEGSYSFELSREFSEQIVEASAVPLLLTLLGLRVSREQDRSLEVELAAAEALRNLAFHADCVVAFSRIDTAIDTLLERLRRECAMDSVHGPMGESLVGCLRNLSINGTCRRFIGMDDFFVPMLGATLQTAGTAEGEGGEKNLQDALAPSLRLEIVGCLSNLCWDNTILPLVADVQGLVARLVGVAREASSVSAEVDSTANETRGLACSCIFRLSAIPEQRSVITEAGGEVLLASLLEPDFDAAGAILQEAIVGTLSRLLLVDDFYASQRSVAEAGAIPKMASIIERLLHAPPEDPVSALVATTNVAGGHVFEYVMDCVLLLSDYAGNRPSMAAANLIPLLVGVTNHPSSSPRCNDDAQASIRNLMGESISQTGRSSDSAPKVLDVPSPAALNRPGRRETDKSNSRFDSLDTGEHAVLAHSSAFTSMRYGKELVAAHEQHMDADDLPKSFGWNQKKSDKYTTGFRLAAQREKSNHATKGPKAEGCQMCRGPDVGYCRALLLLVPAVAAAAFVPALLESPAPAYALPWNASACEQERTVSFSSSLCSGALGARCEVSCIPGFEVRGNHTCNLTTGKFTGGSCAKSEQFGFCSSLQSFACSSRAACARTGAGKLDFACACKRGFYGEGRRIPKRKWVVAEFRWVPDGYEATETCTPLSTCGAASAFQSRPSAVSFANSSIAVVADRTCMALSACPDGSFVARNRSAYRDRECFQCPAGTFQPAENAYSCPQCAAGTFDHDGDPKTACSVLEWWHVKLLCAVVAVACTGCWTLLSASVLSRYVAHSSALGATAAMLSFTNALSQRRCLDTYAWFVALFGLQVLRYVHECWSWARVSEINRYDKAQNVVSSYHAHRSTPIVSGMFGICGSVVAAHPSLGLVASLTVMLQVGAVLAWDAATLALDMPDGLVVRLQAPAYASQIGWWVLALALYWSLQTAKLALHAVAASCTTTWYDGTHSAGHGALHARGLSLTRWTATAALKLLVERCFGQLCRGSLFVGPVYLGWHALRFKEGWAGAAEIYGRLLCTRYSAPAVTVLMAEAHGGKQRHSWRAAAEAWWQHTQEQHSLPFQCDELSYCVRLMHCFGAAAISGLVALELHALTPAPPDRNPLQCHAATQRVVVAAVVLGAAAMATAMELVEGVNSGVWDGLSREPLRLTVLRAPLYSAITLSFENTTGHEFIPAKNADEANKANLQKKLRQLGKDEFLDTHKRVILKGLHGPSAPLNGLHGSIADYREAGDLTGRLLVDTDDGGKHAVLATNIRIEGDCCKVRHGRCDCADAKKPRKRGSAL